MGKLHEWYEYDQEEFAEMTKAINILIEKIEVLEKKVRIKEASEQ